MVNENNYIGASATVVGYAASEARPPAYDKDGSKGVLEISIPINEGYKKDGEFVQTGTTWYTYSAAGDYAATLKSIHKGDKVRVDDAKQEVREYTNKDGEKVKAISLRFGSIAVIEAKSDSGSSDGFTPDDGAAGF
jgi:hypothetical protein